MEQDQVNRETGQEPQASHSPETSEAPLPVGNTRTAQEQPQDAQASSNQQNVSHAPEPTQAATLEALPANPLQAEVRAKLEAISISGLTWRILG